MDEGRTFRVRENHSLDLNSWHCLWREDILPAWKMHSYCNTNRMACTTDSQSRVSFYKINYVGELIGNIDFWAPLSKVSI